MDKHPHSETVLLSHSAWVHGVVRAMVRDEHLAQDIAQDAMEAGLRTGAKQIRDPRAWLLGVIRNLHRQEARAGARRRATELRKPAPGEEPESEELLARLEVQQIVARAVMDLPDPFRSVLILRFYEGATIRKMAARYGIHRHKAESQVRRGLTLLRQQLKGKLGKSWAVAVLPLALPATASAATVTAISLVGATSTKILLGIAAGALAWIGFEFWGGAESPGETGLARLSKSSEIPEFVLSANPGVEAGMTAQSAGVKRTELGGPPEVDGDWIVRGNLTDGEHPAPRTQAMLVVHGGYDAAAPILQEIPLESDASGRIVWGGEAPRLTVFVKLRTVDPEQRPGWGNGVLVLQGDPPPQNLQLEFFSWSRTVRGTVRDTEGRPVEGAWVQTSDQSGTTDGAGKFTLPVASTRTSMLVFAQAPGLAQVMQEVRFDEDTKGLDFVLPPEVVVRGKVIDAHGLPIVDAEILNLQLYRQSTTSDRAGRFELRSLRPDSFSIDLYAEKEGYPTVKATVNDVVAGTEVEVEFVLRMGGVVQGRVRDASGAAVEAAQITIRSSNRGGWARESFSVHEAYSDSSGFFLVKGVDAGPSTAFVERRGYIPTQVDFDMESGEGQVVEVPIQMTEGRIITVQVLDAAGEPVADAGVIARPKDRSTSSRTRTDGFGRATLQHMSDDELVITVGKTGYRKSTTALPNGENHLDVRLAQVPVLRGVVLDAQTGEPVPKFRLHLTGAERRPGEDRVSGIPGELYRGRQIESATGSWEVRADLEPGRWVGLFVVAEGYSRYEDLHIRVPLLGEEQELVCRLEAGVRLTGLVAPREGGPPIAGAKLTWIDPEHIATHSTLDERNPTTFSDSYGRFAFDGIPPRAACLVVEHEDWPRHLEGPISLSPTDQEKEIRVLLEAGVSLWGRVLGVDGKPMESVQIIATLTDHAVLDLKHVTTSDIEGYFRIDNIPIGSYSVRARILENAQWWTFHSARGVRVGADGLEWSLRLASASRITGRIMGAHDLPKLIPVLAVITDASGRETEFGGLARDGVFEIVGLPPGKYRVEIPRRLLDGGVVVVAEETTVEVRAGVDTHVELHALVE